MSHPYNDLPDRSFWRLAVGDKPSLQISDLWRPKFCVDKSTSIATLGSCFAQHVSQALIAAGYNWWNGEPAPPRLPDALKAQYQYDIFSARTGNIYTVALLGQWVRWAMGLEQDSKEVWRDGDRFYDPFRPNIEPNGFASEGECYATRAQTIRALRSMFENCDVFIFTLGLTEAWLNSESGCVYPMCPGTVAGRFVAPLHQFKNYTYPEIYSDLCEIVRTIKECNSTIKILLTVSPVPLVATASGEHVLVATSYSKSVLRAAAGAVAAAFPDVDYFPSYEMISSFPFRAIFYEQNLRSVSKEGISFVMKALFDQIAAGNSGPAVGDGANASSHHRWPNSSGPVQNHQPIDEICEEMMLDRRMPK